MSQLTKGHIILVALAFSVTMVVYLFHWGIGLGVGFVLMLVAVAMIAQDKNRSVVGWMLLTLFISPIAVALLIILPVKPEVVHEYESDMNTMPSPEELARMGRGAR